MALDIRTAQNQLEDLLRDTILYALGKRIANVTSIANLRLFVTQGMTGTVLNNDTLAAVVSSGIVTGSYRWSQESTATDDGVNVVKPTDVSANGRWLLWTSPTRFVPVIGGNSFYLHEIAQGPIARILILDKGYDPNEVSQLITGQIPSVLIEATDDKPVDMTFAGNRWDTRYEFTISVIDQNLRDRRQSTHGSAIDGTIGANLLDGHIKALISGTSLAADETGIRNIQIGKGENWYSGEAQRRVIRSRDYSIVATEEYPAAPNDTEIVERVDIQEQLADLGDLPEPTLLEELVLGPQSAPLFDTDNFLFEGVAMNVFSPGLTKALSIGSATIDGDFVAYAGGLVTFPAESDTYRDLLPNGTLVLVSVARETQAPAHTPTALRVGLTVTDGSGVISDRYVCETKIDYMSPRQTSLT